MYILTLIFIELKSYSTINFYRIKELIQQLIMWMSLYINKS
mgnify:CR=1 FL=1